MKLVKYFLIFVICCILLGAVSIFCLYKYIDQQLPDVAVLKDIRLQTPMLVYSAEGELIAQYGEKRRIPLSLGQIPPQLIQAVIATEDSRFYKHHGIDPIGILRAIFVVLSSGYASQGASTITQQLARNFFLNRERSIIRKIKEIFLALRIERFLTKDEILELYLNKIYFGYRAYGVGAAAEVYFGKKVSQLTLAEMAMIAGLPKAPSIFNPLYSYHRAMSRRNVVLARMLEVNYITQKQYKQAGDEPIVANYHAPQVEFSAPYLSEMVRQEMIKRFGENAYTDGYQVYTTITKKLQLAATKALRVNVLAYDMRHGYRGASGVLWKAGEVAWGYEQIMDWLGTLPVYGSLLPAVVTQVNEKNATVLLSDGNYVILSIEGVRWARPFKSDTLQGKIPKQVNDVVHLGQQIWVRKVNNSWWLAQVPAVNSALVSINPNDGAISALVGGFDFNHSKFNRVTQSLRQVGSNIKPFLYAAILDKGFTLSSIFNDLPISRWDAGAGVEWRPKNSPPTYSGAIRLRQGLGQSKNVVMVRIIRSIGVDYAADYLQRFGFPAQNIVRTESLALGSPSFTPLQLVRGYSVLVNGGYLVDPYFISKISDNTGNLLFVAQPKIAGERFNPPVIEEKIKSSAVIFNENRTVLEINQISHLPARGAAPIELLATKGNKKEKKQKYAPQVISGQLSFLMRDVLNSNIFGESGWMGTGWRAIGDLKRNDIGGKTGTTNDSKDAWFSGYGPDIVTSVWIGFDDHSRSLGRSSVAGVIENQISGVEGGAKSAQGAWNDFMKVALAGIPERKTIPPEGIVSVMIDKQTGKLSKGGSGSRVEYFIEGTQPTVYPAREVATKVETKLAVDDDQVEELF
ncbi:peptidoglycan glycosyltransferase/peptidoglycan DD-transpeptidase MrcA [Candidatus Regiella endosymbiont of Tuberolachnus salignus]|uniref:peptidoglycan glycosyltransferase/peptidoglycan DD-transpeptidase MrcA n=1 Tax=Candidatus Regiella endosymbiont of Tuberolachnus salignus TaxID=3077956 RepID=UPI0030CDB597